MNGGYAIKVTLPPTDGRAALEEGLASIALAEGLELELLSLDDSALSALMDGKEPQLVFGVRQVGREAIIVPRDKFDADTSLALASALADWFSGPIAQVLDTDDGAERLAAWNGGASLKPDTGWLSFGGSDVEWYVEFVAPPFTRLDGARARALLSKLEAARPASLREVDAHFTAVSTRRAIGALSVALDDLAVTVTLAGAQLTIVARSGSPAATTAAVMERTLRALDSFEFPQNVQELEVAADATLMRAVRRELPADARLDTFVRKGPPSFSLSRATWIARGVLDGEPFETTVDEPFDGEAVAAHLAEELVEALEAVRAERKAEADGNLEGRYLTALHEGDFEAAATAYAELYFPQRARDATVLANAREKIEELAVLYRVQRRT